ncbi:SDR family NAD(P)-dependent oxidoreductase [Actinomadura chibensis]|uniref:SDR family oxidoreductase n=1 Tax=Actinomadura chibensis TaxID=392828 RepID=A0A5D0NU51_9ACTN|nr:SDR family NAD(P)-dependent oxidoreductase [Actinomadura chibensis]TYB48220.1 SDR family oxidoreductase [Actinomadura chibensis]
MTGTVRTCLVTGGSRGIGAAVATRLELEGHRVARVSRTGAGASERSMSVRADLTDDAQLESAIQEVEDRWGPVEVLVANAGAAAESPIVDETDQTWQGLLDLNLSVPFRLMRRTLPAMTAAGWGRIVAIGSVASLRGEPRLGAYTAGKHGLLGLVRSVAAEVAKDGVTVNAVCPGYVDTALTRRTVKEIARRLDESEDRALLRLARRHPIRRLVRPDEVADAVRFCIGNAALNGQSIVLDGGSVQS